MRYKSSILFFFLCLASRPSPVHAQDYPAASGLIVFMVAEPEYHTHESLRAFTDTYVLPWSLNAGYQITFVLADPEDSNNFPDIAKIEDAALLVLSVRRRTLKPEALGIIKSYLASGKPLIALRTSSHAFHLRNKRPPAGHADWETFDVDILGAKYENHFANDLHPLIRTTPSATSHPIFEGVSNMEYTSGGSLYRSRDLAGTTTVLLEGQITENEERHTEPVAWTNELDGQKIFYTSLGHLSDFHQEDFQRMLSNAMRWSLAK